MQKSSVWRQSTYALLGFSEFQVNLVVGNVSDCASQNHGFKLEEDGVRALCVCCACCMLLVGIYTCWVQHLAKSIGSNSLSCPPCSPALAHSYTHKHTLTHASSTDTLHTHLATHSHCPLPARSRARTHTHKHTHAGTHSHMYTPFRWASQTSASLQTSSHFHDKHCITLPSPSPSHIGTRVTNGNHWEKLMTFLSTRRCDCTWSRDVLLYVQLQNAQHHHLHIEK